MAFRTGIIMNNLVKFVLLAFIALQRLTPRRYLAVHTHPIPEVTELPSAEKYTSSWLLAGAVRMGVFRLV